MKRKLFLDLDGVLADFHSHYQACFGESIECSHLTKGVSWHKVGNYKGFYQNLPKMHDFDVLWKATEKFNPTIITGIPFVQTVPEAAQNKRDWVEKHLGKHVPVITCMSKNKSLHCKPGDVLIDDWEKYMHLWRAKGGIWITHRSAEQSLEELRKIEEFANA